MRYTFSGVLYSIGQLCCLDLPSSVSRAMGEGERVPVEVRLGDLTGQTSAVPRREGGHRLYLEVRLRRAGRVEAGDRISVTISRDARQGEPELPEALVEALAAVPGGMRQLMERSPADRRQLVRWIEQPKSAAARLNRVRKAVILVLRGKPERQEKPPGGRRRRGGKVGA